MNNLNFNLYYSKQLTCKIHYLFKVKRPLPTSVPILEPNTKCDLPSFDVYIVGKFESHNISGTNADEFGKKFMDIIMEQADPSK